MAQRYPNSIPAYLAAEQQQSTDSNESNDSVATQMPTAFYNDGTTAYQPQGYPPQYNDQSGYQASGAYQHSGLNPITTGFVPSTYATSNVNGIGSQYGSEAGYNACAYSQIPSKGYGAYGASVAQGEFAGYSNFQMNPYGVQDPYAPQHQGDEYQTYGQGNYGGISPTISYSSRAPGPEYNNFHTSGYQSYTQAQGNGMMSSAYGKGYANPQYPVQYPTGYQRNGQRLPSNENRGRPATSYTSSGTSSRRQSNAEPGNGVHTSPNNGCHNNLNSQSGAGQRPTSARDRSRSPAKIVKAPTTDLSEHCDPQKTPAVTQKQYEAKEFQSERRGTQTPTTSLRHTRHKSVAGTEHSSHKKTLSWIGKTPLTEMNNSSSHGVKIASPPKMRSLTVSAGGDAKALCTIVENDPFAVQATPRRGTFNPFVNTLTTPGSQFGGSLRGQGPRMSPMLFQLTKNGKPGYKEVCDVLPFIEYCRTAQPNDRFGVIRIKNIPYSVNRSEIFAFLGRNARLVNEQEYEPIHIVMERVTSKTLDCYVEFINFNEAVAAVNRFETNRTGGRGGRLGQRHVEIELSSQDQLMKDLFPKAKNVVWREGAPWIVEKDPNDPYNSGFQGFVSKEELVMLVKHVEAPQRSPFSKDCPQRPFECAISTLLKYPWYMVDFITIEDRELLHKATVTLLRFLRERIDNAETPDLNITEMLYKRVWRAALICPGFSPSQKDDFICMARVPQEVASDHGVPEYAAAWKSLWTIGPKRDAPADLVNYLAAIIREYTAPKKELTLAERAARGGKLVDDKIFGHLSDYTEYPDYDGFQHLTLAQVGVIEWGGIEKVLKACLTHQIEH